MYQKQLWSSGGLNAHQLLGLMECHPGEQFLQKCAVDMLQGCSAKEIKVP